MPAAAPARPATALVLDWGGVLTKPFRAGMVTWADAEGVDLDHFLALLAEHLGPLAVVPSEDSPFHAVECGQIAADAFERRLAAMLRRRDGLPVVPDGLLARMFAGFTLVEPMTALVRRARAAGVPTALLSNSWGQPYPTRTFAELFDVTVLSCEVGVRKPDPAAYRLVARLLGQPPEACVFVDDLRSNVEAAAAVGMTALQHRDCPTTVAAVCRYLGLPTS
jgi:epoxide hydrolase-like predicted phosphatase